MFNWVIPLIVLYDGIMLVRSFFYSTTNPFVIYVAISISYGNHTNDNNTTAPSSSLFVDAFTIAVTLPWVRRVYVYST